MTPASFRPVLDILPGLRAFIRQGVQARALPVWAVLVAASAGILSATYFADQAVRTLARQSLESTARGISLAAEQVLLEDEDRNVQFERLFSDRIVAYALIADPGGIVLFHTNPDLRGSVFEDRKTYGGLTEGTAASRRELLGTGRPVAVRSTPPAAGEPPDAAPPCAPHR